MLLIIVEEIMWDGMYYSIKKLCSGENRVRPNSCGFASVSETLELGQLVTSQLRSYTDINRMQEGKGVRF